VCTGLPSAPKIFASGSSSMLSNFNLNIEPPSESAYCVTDYRLIVIRIEDGTTAFNGTIASSILVNGTTDLLTIDSSLDILTCQYTYTFELTAVGSSMSSGIQKGDPNFDGMQVL